MSHHERLRNFLRAHTTLFIVVLIVFTTSQTAFAEVSGGEAELDTVAAKPDPVAANRVKAREAVRNLEAAKQEMRALYKSVEGTAEEGFDLKRLEIREVLEGMGKDIRELLEILSAVEMSTALGDSIQNAVESSLRFQADLARDVDALHSTRLAEANDQRQGMPPESLGRLEVRIGEAEQLLAGNLARILGIGMMQEKAGLDASGLWEWTDGRLAEHAKQLEIQLQLAVMARRRALEQIDAAQQIGISPDDEQLLRFQAAEIRIAAIISGLSSITDFMETRGIEPAKYRLMVIQATGEITEHILNWKVLVGLVRGGAIDILGWLRQNAPTALLRLGIVILFALLFRLLGWFFWYMALLFRRPPKLLGNLLRRMVRPTSTIIGVLAGLWFLGVDPTTLLAGLGVMSIIVGLALQDSLGNLAAGLFILLYKPYDIDQIVLAGGVLGRVKGMGLANTTIITFDNRRFFIPNRKIWGDIIENRSLEKVRRVQATVRVSYDEDIVKVLQSIGEILKESDLILETPAPAIFVSKLDDSWLQVSVWPWTKTETWWDLETELPLMIRVGLAKRGVTVPYPRQAIDISSEGQPGTQPGA